MATVPMPTHGGASVTAPVIKKSTAIAALPAAPFTDAALKTLAEKMLIDDDPKDGPDDEENPYTPAGYTYLGQFVDHDLTFDTTSQFGVPSPNGVHSDRTPAFDLDCVYGAGPADSPYLYSDDDGATLLLGDALANGAPDLLRNPEGRAIIGDKRNDENAIVSQLQSVFIRFHNLNVLRAKLEHKPGQNIFERARDITRWFYQKILVNDFLPRVVEISSPPVRDIYDALKASRQPNFRIFDIDNPGYMPAEFAVAAYRFGHSMVRPGYRLSGMGEDRLLPIFLGDNSGLRGFKRLPRDNFIDWSLFFGFDPRPGVAMNQAEQAKNNAFGRGRTQFAYKIDTMMVNPLGNLPMAVAGNTPINLAQRNLMRGRDFLLPSGEDVANLLGLQPLPRDRISVRHGGSFDHTARMPAADLLGVEGRTPLWFYILAEAEQAVATQTPNDPMLVGGRLGPVGGTIVVETFAGLLFADPNSVVNTDAATRDLTPELETKLQGYTMMNLLYDIGAL